MKCPNCFCSIEGYAEICPHCSFVFEKSGQDNKSFDAAISFVPSPNEEQKRDGYEFIELKRSVNIKFNIIIAMLAVIIILGLLDLIIN